MRAYASGFSFAAGMALAFLLGSALLVYGFGQFERAKGPDVTFQILAWLAPMVAGVAVVPYVFGALKWSFWPQWPVALAAGALVCLLFCLVAWALPQNPVTSAMVWVVGLAGSFFAPRVLRPRKA